MGPGHPTALLPMANRRGLGGRARVSGGTVAGAAMRLEGEGPNLGLNLWIRILHPHPFASHAAGDLICQGGRAGVTCTGAARACRAAAAVQPEGLSCVVTADFFLAQCPALVATHTCLGSPCSVGDTVRTATACVQPTQGIKLCWAD